MTQNAAAQSSASISLIGRPTGRVALWIVLNSAIFVAVSITNGFLVYFLGATASLLFSSWMLTLFLIRSDMRPKPNPIAKISVAILGTAIGTVFVYGHPLYVGTTWVVLIYSMRLLNRYEMGIASSFLGPLVSLSPLVMISHASYTMLTLSTFTYRYEAIIGYIAATVLLFVSVGLIFKDDQNFLPMVGKSPQAFGIGRLR